MSIMTGNLNSLLMLLLLYSKLPVDIWRKVMFWNDSFAFPWFPIGPFIYYVSTFFRLFRPPSPYLRKHVFSTESTLGCQIDKYTRLFGTKETWRKKETQRQTRVFNKNPSYSFIWPYSINWHLRVSKNWNFLHPRPQAIYI